VNKHLKSLLNCHGINIDRIYYCPHSPIDKCNCRKPKPGLVFQAIHEQKVNPSQSYLVGDK